MPTPLTIEDIVNKTSDLPTIPAAAVQVMREADSATSTAASVAKTLAQDQSLSSRILRLANSAYFGLARKVFDLSDAVIILGMRNVRNLAIVASSYPWMVRPLKGYCLGPRELWTHAFGTALGAQLVAQKAKIAEHDAAFTAGLVSDIGKVALSVWLENKIGGVFNLASRDGLSFDQAERLVLGFDHTEVGAYMAEQWNFPELIVQAIRYHHAPNDCEPSSPVVDCVHIGDYLTMAMGFGVGGDGLQYTFYEEPLQRLGITTEDLDGVADQFVWAYEKYEAVFEELQAA